MTVRPAPALVTSTSMVSPPTAKETRRWPGEPAHQRGLVGVDQRVVDQLGELGVDVPPAEGVHRRLDQLGGYRVPVGRQPPELRFKLVVWLVHVWISSWEASS